jgi:hypothetical protein
MSEGQTPLQHQQHQKNHAACDARGMHSLHSIPLEFLATTMTKHDGGSQKHPEHHLYNEINLAPKKFQLGCIRRYIRTKEGGSGDCELALYYEILGVSFPIPIIDANDGS